MEDTAKLQDKIIALGDELRSHSELTEDVKCVTLCETSAEVMEGLAIAFDDYLEEAQRFSN